MFSVSFLLDRFDFDMFHSPNSSSIWYRDIHFAFYHQLSPSNRRRPKHCTISRRTSHANTTYVLNNVTPFQASNGSPLAALTNTHARGSNAMLVLPSLPLLDFVFSLQGKKVRRSWRRVYCSTAVGFLAETPYGQCRKLFLLLFSRSL